MQQQPDQPRRRPRRRATRRQPGHAARRDGRRGLRRDGQTGRHEVPAEHRATAAACARSRNPLADGGFASCSSNADCASDGSTAAFSTCLHGSCTFDHCLTDADCGSNEVCACSSDYYGGNAAFHGNVCVPGNCHVDSDCGAGGYCSPSRGYLRHVPGLLLPHVEGHLSRRGEGLRNVRERVRVRTDHRRVHVRIGDLRRVNGIGRVAAPQKFEISPLVPGRIALAGLLLGACHGSANTTAYLTGGATRAAGAGGVGGQSEERLLRAAPGALSDGDVPADWTRLPVFNPPTEPIAANELDLARRCVCDGAVCRRRASGAACRRDFAGRRRAAGARPAGFRALSDPAGGLHAGGADLARGRHALRPLGRPGGRRRRPRARAHARRLRLAGGHVRDLPHRRRHGRPAGRRAAERRAGRGPGHLGVAGHRARRRRRTRARRGDQAAWTCRPAPAPNRRASRPAAACAGSPTCTRTPRCGAPIRSRWPSGSRR